MLHLKFHTSLNQDECLAKLRSNAVELPEGEFLKTRKLVNQNLMKGEYFSFIHKDGSFRLLPRASFLPAGWSSAYSSYQLNGKLEKKDNGTLVSVGVDNGGQFAIPLVASLVIAFIFLLSFVKTQSIFSLVVAIIIPAWSIPYLNYRRKKNTKQPPVLTHLISILNLQAN